MKYTQKSFNSSPSSSSYRDNYDRIFRQCSSEFEFRGEMLRCSKEKKPEHEVHQAEAGYNSVQWTDAMTKSLVPR